MTQKITNQSQAAQAAAKATELQSYRATELQSYRAIY